MAIGRSSSRKRCQRAFGKKSATTLFTITTLCNGGPQQLVVLHMKAERLVTPLQLGSQRTIKVPLTNTAQALHLTS